MTNTINAATLALNTAGEACAQAFIDTDGVKKYRAYDDKHPEKVLRPGDAVEGTLSIGYGHTGPDVYVGLVWTQQQVDDQRLTDMQVAESAVNDALANARNVTLTNNQFGAIADLVFNIGTGNFLKSRLRSLLVSGKLSLIPAEFPKWVKAKGAVEPGLQRRRAMEVHLYMTPDVVPVSFAPAEITSLTPDPVKEKTLLTSATAWGIATGMAAPALAQPLQDAASQLSPFTELGPWVHKAALSLGFGGMCCAMMGKFKTIKEHGV